MGFSFYKTSSVPSKIKIDGRILFTIGTKRERKRLSRYIKTVEYTVPNIEINLTCFPKIENYHQYNKCLTNETLRWEVTSLVTKLNRNGHLVAAEIYLKS